MYKYVKTSLELIKTDKRAVTALEYGLIAAAVVAVGLVGFGSLMGKLSNEFNSVANSMT